MLGQESIGPLGDGIPEMLLRQFPGRQSFRKQGVEFVRRRGKLWKSALFHGGQGRLDYLVNGFVSATTQERLQPALLFRREVDRHGGSPCLPFRLRESQLTDNWKL